ncbi:hypothetical protein ACHAXT_001967 [Thalassiosira profunda]
MAAALNWVMKDGMGQLGGVIFASQLGKGGMDFDHWRGKIRKLTGSGTGGPKDRGNFQRGTADTNPKRWRMVAALALDLSTLLEICTPAMGPQWFLPMASIANVGKNVGFLAASASRAAIHQSLTMGGSLVDTPSSEESPKPAKATAAKSSNLGDVTAKAGSQAIVASLLGTAVGILLSRTFCSDHGTAGILAGFVVLSFIHQVCTYKAVKAVPLLSLDRHRLHIILSSYMNEQSNGAGCAPVLTPAQVAEKESFLPLLRPDDSSRWLTVGASLTDICPSGAAGLKELLLPKPSPSVSSIDESGAFDPQQHEKYLLRVHPTISAAKGSGAVQLTFFKGATDTDLLRGMYHAYAAHSFMQNDDDDHAVVTESSLGSHICSETHMLMSSQMPTFVQHLREAGWQVGGGFVNVECGSSYRLHIQ